jgi:hypothetical protein
VNSELFHFVVFGNDYTGRPESPATYAFVSRNCSTCVNELNRIAKELTTHPGYKALIVRNVEEVVTFETVGLPVLVAADSTGLRAIGLTFYPTFVQVRGDSLHRAWKGVPNRWRSRMRALALIN